jgi:hypothetical protein
MEAYEANFNLTNENVGEKSTTQMKEISNHAINLNYMMDKLEDDWIETNEAM